MTTPHTMAAQHQRTIILRPGMLLEVAAHTTAHIGEALSVADTLTEGEELLRIIRIIARHRHMAPPNSRTALLCSTSQTCLLKPLAPRVLQLLGQRRCRTLIRDRIVHRQQSPSNFVQLSHRQVPRAISTPQDLPRCDTSNFSFRNMYSPRLPSSPRPEQTSALQALAL